MEFRGWFGGRFVCDEANLRSVLHIVQYQAVKVHIPIAAVEIQM